MLKVYMTGLVYIHGCNTETPLAFLPDGSGDGTHYASLWADVATVDSWSWPASSVKERELEFKPPGEPKQTVSVYEFRIPSAGAIVSFPDGPSAPPQCLNLNNHLPRLMVTGPGGPVPFDIDPDEAETIARVAIRGGEVRPHKFKNIGVVEWSIPAHSSLQVTVSVGGDNHTITLKAPPAEAAAEIVLANMHEVSEVKKMGQGNHFALYKKLNPGVSGNLVAPGQPGSAPELSNFTTAYLQFLRGGVLVAGETPGCCRG